MSEIAIRARTRVLVLGASGTGGRLIAAELLRRGVDVTLAGRDPGRLAQAAEELAAETGLRPETLRWPASELPAEIGVLVNAAGPFSSTTPAAIDAALAARVDYLDIANDLPAVFAVLERADEAAQRGVTLLTAAGFGATAGDAAVRDATSRLDGPVRSVEVAAVPESRYRSAGATQTVLDALPHGVQVYRGGRRRSILPGSGQTKVELPKGRRTLLPVPVGELEAARRATGAPSVTAYSSELPAGVVARVALPIAQAAVSIGPLRRLLARRVGGRPTEELAVDGPAPSLAWARVTGENGQIVESTWTFPEGYEVTARAVAGSASRLLKGAGRPGAWIPGELFGTDIAIESGGAPAR
jgi:short subunit dehydrogenase-like uncharacterized protein